MKITSPKTIKIIGLALTGLIAVAVAMSGLMKLSMSEMALEQSRNMGLQSTTLQLLGLVELISVVLFVIPRTGVVGSLLLIAYFGGAITVHLLTHETILVPLVFEVMIWITAAIRFPELPGRLFKNQDKMKPELNKI